MTIRERGGRYQAIVKYKGRQVEVKTFGTRKEAKAWHDRIAARYRGSRFSTSLGQVLVSQVIDDFLAYRKTRLTENGLETDSVVMRMIPENMKERRVGGIEACDFQFLIDRWSRDRKVATVVRYADSLKAFTAFCVRRGYMAHDIMEDVEIPKRRKIPRELRPLNEGEIEALVAAIGGFYGDVVLVLAFSGLRFGEARALRVGDVSLDGVYPHFNVFRSQSEGKSEKTTKNERRRSVPIDPRIVEVVSGYMKGRKRTDYLLSRDGRSQIWRSRFVRSTNWGQLGDGRTIHDFRHTAAVHWLRRGIAANTVQAWLGHSDLEATTIYTSYLGMDIDAGAYAKLEG